MQPVHDPAGTLTELGAQLLACAEPGWLDAPLFQLGSRLADAEARELLVEVYEAGEASSLRELLDREPLLRWSHEVATPHEQSILLRQLRRWLGFGQSGADDAARLVAVPEPPRELEALLAWARPYDVLDELIRPISEVLAGTDELAPNCSVAECCLGQFDAAAVRGSVLARDRLMDDARGHLHRRAAANAALLARIALWQRPPASTLEALHARLRAVVVGDGAAAQSKRTHSAANVLAMLNDATFVPARPVTVEAASGVCRAQLRLTQTEHARAVRIYLSGYEQRALHAECDCPEGAAMKVHHGRAAEERFDRPAEKAPAVRAAERARLGEVARESQLGGAAGQISAVRGADQSGLENAARGSWFRDAAQQSRLGSAAGGSSFGQHCLHVRALAARLIDACCDPQDRLQPALIEFVSIPSWQRFVRALHAEPAAEREARSERVSFRIRVDGDRAYVGAFVQKPLPGGRVTPGKLASPQKLARSRACTERDRPVLELMSALSRTLGAQWVGADLTLLRSLVEHPQLELELERSDGERESVHLSEQTVQLRLLEQPEGVIPRLSLAGRPVAAGARRRDLTYLLGYDSGSRSLAVAALTPPLRRLLAALADFHGVLPPESYPMLSPWLATMRQVAQVSAPAALRGNERPSAKKLLLRITPRLETGVDVLLAVRSFALGPLWSPGRGPVLVDGLEGGVAVHTRRDLDAERSAAETVIEALQLEQHMRLEPFAYRIESIEETLALLSQAARLHELLDIEWAENARRLRLLSPVNTGALKVELRRNGHWLQLSGGAVSRDAEIAIGRLLDTVRRGERFVQVSGGDYAEIERELFERLEKAQLCVMDPQHAPHMARSALPFWLDQLESQTRAADEGSRDWLARLAARSELDPPAELTALDPRWQTQLRDYQRHGVAWLLSASRWADGACLADEMGLGKTIQTIALLCARAQLGPALIVAPTSVVSNWQSELARFAPELHVRLYRGAHRRERLAGLGPGCVLVGSYELLLRDRESFEGQKFATQVIDEAQTVRNARTRRARAVASIDSAFRVALTGTPVENRLADLWSLFSLIAPGLLGSWSRFRALFAVPIERYENAERAAELRGVIAPFMLRRTKREVARELPPRTEVVHLVEPSAAEQALYTAAVQQARRALGKRIRADDASRHLQILAELTKLRLLACHPRLVIDDARVESSKLLALMQLAHDILPRGHRALVFSQFVRHLTLVREAFDRAGISYVYLDGSTPAAQRAELVERFQNAEAQAFLISLKAGGTGLNLTAADYVVHLDPWWNPAAEDQASDRAHRVGQERPVTVVKLVSRGTIEEKVLELHMHKRRIAEAALGVGEGEAPPPLDAAVLEALLR
jgi:superfamily II DNA or RNA helicase